MEDKLVICGKFTHIRYRNDLNGFTVASFKLNDHQEKTITVKFINYNNDNSDIATKDVSFSVEVPAWTSYSVSYNATNVLNTVWSESNGMQNSSASFVATNDAK